MQTYMCADTAVQTAVTASQKPSQTAAQAALRPAAQPAVRAFAGLGSNSENALSMLEQARAGLAALEGVCITAASPVYVTEPQGYADQPWFHNQVLELAVQDKALRADVSAAALAEAARGLLRAMLDLETALGRVRSPDPALRFGPRCIDIDLLLFGELRLDDPCCTVPHPRLTKRAFWLVPLRDIAPDVLIAGETSETHLARLTWHLEANTIFQ